MKKESVNRILFYCLGLFILALGLTLNTKAGMGVSAIISVPYCISLVFNLNFGDMTFIAYGLFIVVEIILHWRRKADYENIKLIILCDILQFPISLVFTRLLNVFSVVIPDYHVLYEGHYIICFIVLLVAILFTGIGAALSLDMHLVPNPGDGIVQAIAETIHKSVGFTKNCVDLFCFCLTLIIGYIFTGSIVGIGIGTLIAVIGVGRIIAGFNALCLKPLNKLCGLENQG